jgi:hypothetical protein
MERLGFADAEEIVVGGEPFVVYRRRIRLAV